MRFFLYEAQQQNFQLKWIVRYRVLGERKSALLPLFRIKHLFSGCSFFISIRLGKLPRGIVSAIGRFKHTELCVCVCSSSELTKEREREEEIGGNPWECEHKINIQVQMVDEVWAFSIQHTLLLHEAFTGIGKVAPTRFWHYETNIRWLDCAFSLGFRIKYSNKVYIYVHHWYQLHNGILSAILWATIYWQQKIIQYNLMCILITISPSMLY